MQTTNSNQTLHLGNYTYAWDEKVKDIVATPSQDVLETHRFITQTRVNDNWAGSVSEIHLVFSRLGLVLPPHKYLGEDDEYYRSSNLVKQLLQKLRHAQPRTWVFFNGKGYMNAPAIHMSQACSDIIILEPDCCHCKHFYYSDHWASCGRECKWCLAPERCTSCEACLGGFYPRDQTHAEDFGGYKCGDFVEKQ